MRIDYGVADGVVILLLLLLILAQVLPTPVRGTINLPYSEFLTEYKDSLAQKQKMNGEFVPLKNQQIADDFFTLLLYLLQDRFVEAETWIATLNSNWDVNYELVRLESDASHPVHKLPVHGFMEVASPGDSDYKGWGTFLVRPNAGGNIVYQAPHPLYDTDTQKIALKAFALDKNARVAMFAGTHRYANCPVYAPGKNKPEPPYDLECDSDMDGEVDSDVAHDTDSLFHRLSKALIDHSLTNQVVWWKWAARKPYWFIQFHGSGGYDDDPTIVGSDGACSKPPHPTLTANSPLVKINDIVDDIQDASGASIVSMGICGWYEGSGGVDENGNAVDLDGDYFLCATGNAQGKMLDDQGLRERFMHFEIESSARDPEGEAVDGLLHAIRKTLRPTQLVKVLIPIFIIILPLAAFGAYMLLKKEPKLKKPDPVSETA